MSENPTRFPIHGLPKAEILEAMQAARAHDVKWHDGKVFSLVFHAGDEIGDLLKEAYTMFFSENGLNPTAFPSLRQFETQVVAMVASLLGSDGSVVGNMTTGGTESLLMAVKTARDYARLTRPHIREPEIIIPASAHPALDKAGEYFDVRVIRTPIASNLQADVAVMRAAISPNTILLVGSAPSYPHGIVDPIPEIAELAREHNLLCHVDACVGGMMLPFVRRLGYPVTDFDFSVPGVTSLSVDLHKYGYAAKGASVILYRNRELRRPQIFVSTDWAGGIYASPTMTGTRPGGAIAAAWAVLNYLGEEGYMAIADVVMKTAVKIRDGINAIDGIKVMGNPEMSVMAIASDRLNVYEIGDEMTMRGWHLDRQQFPPTLHVTINYAHAQRADEFLSDLAESVAIAQKPSLGKIGNTFIVNAARLATRVLPESIVSRLTARASSLFGGSSGLPERSAAMYGMMGTLPNRGDLKELVLDLVEGFTTPTPPR
jgi:sphinganine-1-phosphate aldolase